MKIRKRKPRARGVALVQSGPRYRKGDKIGGRYLVHRALAGGMGEVYLCLDLEQNLPYALKTFQARYLTSAKAREYFEREAATWVALEKHPNVVRCFYLTKVENTPFLFLEWVAGAEGYGTDLRGWLERRGPLEPRLALEFTLDVCRALAHAQKKVPGFVHCDIKPDNVLVAQGNLAKLTDFGLAKLVREAGLAPEDGAVSGPRGRWAVSRAGGTPPYMAPEQWRGEAVDPRTDVYAVGCLLYELLSGRWPYLADSLDGLKRQHLEAPVPRFGGIVHSMRAGDPDAVLARCLAKVPESRYPSSSELIAAITGLYEGWYGQPPREVAEAVEFTAVDYNNRGTTYDTLGSHDEALADFDAAIRLDPNHANAYVNRGKTYHVLGNHTQALVDLDAAIRLDSSYAPAYSIRGNIHRALGHYAEAMAGHDAAIGLDPSYAPAYSNRGATRAALGRHAEALADLDAAIRLDPSYAGAYYNRGATYAALERHAEAMAEFDSALRLDSNFAMAHVGKGALHTRRDEWNDALRAFEVAARLGDPKGAKYAAHVRQIMKLPPSPGEPKLKT
jgi:serine/threonine protein kinase